MLWPVLQTLRMARRGPGRPRRRPDRVRGDKAYSSRDNRACLRRRGIKATIAEPDDQRADRHNRGRAGGRPPAFDKAQTDGAARSSAASASGNSSGRWPAATTNATASSTAPSPSPRSSSGSATPSKSHQKRPSPVSSPGWAGSGRSRQWPAAPAETSFAAAACALAALGGQDVGGAGRGAGGAGPGSGGERRRGPRSPCPSGVRGPQQRKAPARTESAAEQGPDAR